MATDIQKQRRINLRTVWVKACHVIDIGKALSRALIAALPSTGNLSASRTELELEMQEASTRLQRVHVSTLRQSQGQAMSCKRFLADWQASRLGNRHGRYGRENSALPDFYVAWLMHDGQGTLITSFC